MHLEDPVPEVCNGGAEQGEPVAQPSLKPGELQGGSRRTIFCVAAHSVSPILYIRHAECTLHAREGHKGWG